MRLRWIEPSKSAASSTTGATAPCPAATSTRPATAGPAEPSTTHHSAQHAHHCICHIACRTALPLRLGDYILYSLPNVVLVITSQPICLSHRAIYGDRIVSR
jgi:hypothetical protein